MYKKAKNILKLMNKSGNEKHLLIFKEFILKLKLN